MDVSDTLDKLMAKKALKLEASRERIKERKEAENDVANFILVEMLPVGLYKCRFEKGTLPDCLKGMFTSIQKVRSTIISHYGSDERMKVL